MTSVNNYKSKKLRLNILKYKNDIIEAIKRNQIVIIVGQTGCGKSTQVPQFLHEKRNELNLIKTDIIACLHPRSIAAVNLAERVAKETNTKLGNLVGYRIRFYRAYNDYTRIMYMTAGFMTRLLCINKTEGRYGVVIIDEAHERSIQNDIIMGQMKELIANKSRVKLVIMSATLDVEQLQMFYPGSVVVRVETVDDRVEILYSNPRENDYINEIAAIVEQIIISQANGHILIFLPSENKVRECVKYVKRCPGWPIVLKFYSSMDKKKKEKVFQNYGGQRKIICATNIAETSLTIEGVNFVIDSGFVTRVIYNHERMIENWTTQRISKAEADQRKGRTGRTGPGKCYRLFRKFDIDPTDELLACFKAVPGFTACSKEERREIVEEIERTFNVGQLTQICSMSAEISEKLSTNRKLSKSAVIPLLKEMFETRNNSSFVADAIIETKLQNLLQTVKYFNSLDKSAQRGLTDELLGKLSEAQLRCLTKKTKLSMKRVTSRENFFRRLENIFYDEGITENLLHSEPFSRFTTPEIRTANLGSTILLLKSMEYEDVMNFPFIVEPDLRSVTLSIAHLQQLQLLDEGAFITELGSQVANIPLSPPLGKVAIMGSQSPHRTQILIILAMISVKFIFKYEKINQKTKLDTNNQFYNSEGDLFRLLNVYKEAQERHFSKEWCKRKRLIHSNLLYANLIHEQFEFWLPQFSLEGSVLDHGLEFEIKTMFLCAFFHNLAFKAPTKTDKENKNGGNKPSKPDNGIYTLTSDQECRIDERSCLDGSCKIIMPITLTISNNQSIVMKNCTRFDKEMLQQIEHRYFQIPKESWQSVLGRLKAVK